MKIIYSVLLILAFFIGNFFKAKGQCIIDSSQTAAGLYPAVLPDATAGQPYDEDVTFVMLTDTLGLTIYNYQIANVVGLPVGLNWQCNNSGNGCNYDPAISLWGCVDISGTPLIAGTYTMTVTVIADVQLVGLQSIPFDVPFVVLPGTVTNPGFTMINSVGCDPLTVDFVNNNPGQLTYVWDFGNGLQSNQENPPSQTYTVPGTYVVTQTVTPNTAPSWFLTDITVSSIPDNYGGFIDDPDMYLLIYDPLGVLVYDSHPSVSNTLPPVSWGIPNLPLQNGTYTVHVWDEDGGLFGADDDLGEIAFAGNGVSGQATGTVGGATGILIVDYTIFQTPVVPLVATDTIHVYASPAIPLISASGPLSYCENDSVVLSVNDTVNSIQWFENNIIMGGTTGQSYTPTASGSFSVVVTTPDGCTATSATTTVTIIPLPPKPTFIVNGNTFTTLLTGYNLQWYVNGTAIPGQTGNIHIAQVAGTYVLCATDSNGCENCSDSLVYLGLGMAGISQNHFQVYPNPSDGRFTLLFNDASAEKRTMNITDVTGKLIHKVDLTGQLRYSHKEALQPGAYFISIGENMQQYTTRLIVY